MLPACLIRLPVKFSKKKFDTPQPPKYQDVFGHTILELAEQNPAIFGITPAMPSGSSLKIMMDKMPDRALDVGICEQHAVTVSAGLATQGMKVFCNIYSSFMQRAYDQVVHDVAIQKLPVIFCLDRAGLVGDVIARVSGEVLVVEAVRKARRRDEGGKERGGLEQCDRLQ